MSQHHIVTLDEHDPRVIAAHDAEEQLFACYGLEARTRFVSLPRLGIRVRVNEFGTGEPVLMVPGNTGDAYPFTPLLPELQGRRIITLNRPGGGLSEGMDHHSIPFREQAVETLSAVLDALALPRVPIIGHSIGGHWGLWFALDRPERVTSLTLLGVPGSLLTTHPPFFVRLLSVRGLNRLLLGSILSIIGKQHTPETRTSIVTATAACRYHFQRLPHYRLSTLSLMERTNRLRGSRPEITLSAEQLKRVQQPTMFLWGTNDPFGSSETGRQIAQLLPHSEFHAIQGAGHLPWLSNLTECGQLIRDFLANHADPTIASDLSI